MSDTTVVREWVGGRFALPASIESMGDRSAEMSLWVELPDMHVVGHVLEDPLDPQATFGQSLMRAMSSPLVGEPRRPQRVRVADAELAEQLQSFSFLHVEVAPTPEFDQVVRSLGAFFGEGSYFSDPSLTAEEIEAFFVGARLLWVAQPWTRVDDDALVHIEVPAMGIDDGCVSIVGSLEQVRGFVFFPSYEDYERMTGSVGKTQPGAPLAAHRALYMSFDARDEVPEGMRREVAEHAWPLADDNAYPVLMRMVDGQRAPVFARELQLATAISRALAAFALRHPLALENYGEGEIRESQFDEHDPELILSVPHRSVLQTREPELPPRAPTLSSAPNPYGLPLDPRKLEQLERTLEEFTLHRAMGLFCAVATVPDLPTSALWLGEIMQHVKFLDESQARRVMELLMVVYNHVVHTVEQRAIDKLVPEADDVQACRAWARGYTTLLGRVDPAQIEGDTLDSAFAIQALAEVPQMLKLLDEFRGKDSREAMLARYRESLADDADFLFEAWSERRAEAEVPSTRPDSPFRRETAKVGRNDRCPCGSGKKHKKCCGVV